MYDAKGRLTRAGAMQIIRTGGSVSIRGHVFSSLDNLPGDAFFARGDPGAEAKVAADLQQQIHDAQAQLNAMGIGHQPTPPPPDVSLEEMTSDQLKAMAKERNVPRYWQLGEEKLREALRPAPAAEA